MIHVIDSIMGSRKTTHAIRMMNNEHTQDSRFIYVTPFLKEIDRITKECPSIGFHQPNTEHHKTKRDCLLSLIESGHNIATTHSLFSMLTHRMYDALRDHGYTLVLDEVMQCVSKSNLITSPDLTMLMDHGLLRKEEHNDRLTWVDRDSSSYTGKFNNVMNLCNNGNLALYGGKTVIEEFPHEYLNAFKDVYVLTYLFEGSPMSAYLTKYGHTYKVMTMVGDEVKPRAEHSDETNIKANLRELITVYEGSMNDVGKQQGKECPLSSTWYSRQMRGHPETLKALRGSTGNYFKKIASTKSKLNAWTTFCDYEPTLAGEGYTKGFIPFNCRATNEYIEKRSMAYLCNVYPIPVTQQYLTKQGIGFSQDLYALSEMVQWIWRSQIRRYDPINLFIPSERMRNLLTLWLNTPNTPELIRKLSN